ncbi:MAG: hypothetical protein EOP42_34280, partial [Sphingobacteriaceae bacterium]
MKQLSFMLTPCIFKNLLSIGLLLTFFNTEAQQVKKIDCCLDISSKATIIINDNANNASSSVVVSSNPQNGIFNFELKSNLNTSAGVYNSDGVLIRTLWSGVRYDAGCYEGQWDGLLDDGVTVAPTGNYRIKILTNDVKYDWEGVIGNTFTNDYHQFGGFGPFAFSGTRGYLGDSFAEGGIQTHYFDLSDPHTMKDIDIGLSAIITSVTADDNLVYWACGNQYENPQGNFIFATKISDNTNYVFSAGINHVAGRGASIANSVIGYKTGIENTIGSVSVQRNGNFLFAAQG